MARRLDDVIDAAFKAGAKFGARYPAPDAIPEAEVAIQSRAYRAAVGGHVWSSAEWQTARVDAGLVAGELVASSHDEFGRSGGGLGL